MTVLVARNETKCFIICGSMPYLSASEGGALTTDRTIATITKRVGEVAYRLALPPDLDRVHNVFHVSMLRKYKPDPSHVLRWTDVVVDEDVTYEEGPVQILYSWEQVLRTKTIPLVKVLWRHHSIEEATWELEQEIRSRYPHLFSLSSTA
ncbi:uncharacterized protein LOC132270520 [Cornus florida]|uniref:uncharacterized protein LOC132270520 n=1 Tax=Cornus florida TaxID=4283 RepID=UPI00289F0C40|nr:uncharacterized protein LOC132270520 [Cornus florida]